MDRLRSYVESVGTVAEIDVIKNYGFAVSERSNEQWNQIKFSHLDYRQYFNSDCTTDLINMKYSFSVNVKKTMSFGVIIIEVDFNIIVISSSTLELIVNI